MAKKSNFDITAKINWVNPKKHENPVALGSICIDDAIVICVKVIETKKGELFVQYPRRWNGEKGNKAEYYGEAYFLNSVDADKASEVVLEALNEAK